jgi:triacylglycerol lipase
MQRLAWALRREGYTVLNLRYPSRRENIPTLAERTLTPVFTAAAETDATVDIVTHSLGGILLRQFLHDHPRPPALGHVVMLGPPNQGSEIVDRLHGWRFYRRINGPAGISLGTDSNSVPNRLGPVTSPVGVIAGNISLNPLFSAWIHGPSDGKVSVARTCVAGMTDHLTLRTSHTWMMWRREVIAQVLAFLKDGRFDRGGLLSCSPTR